MIDGRMIVFHSQRKAMEFIDVYEKCQDEKLAVEQIPGYKKKFDKMKRRTKLKDETTDKPEEKEKGKKKRKNRDLDNAIKEIVALKQRLKILEHSLTVYKKKIDNHIMTKNLPVYPQLLGTDSVYMMNY